MREVLDRYGFSKTAINGPAIAYDSGYLAEFAAALADKPGVVTDVTWHHCKHDTAHLGSLPR